MSQPMFEALLRATGETVLMVTLSGLVGFALGLPLGVLLFVTRPGQIEAHPSLHAALALVVNAVRSVPFIILLVAIIPLTRLIVGTSIGTAAAIVPLAIGATPFVARIVEGALMEVPNGLVEAARAMGARSLQIVWKVLLPEALPGILNGATITLVTLVGYSAVAGAVGGGGLGDLGIRYGYQRFDTVVMIAVVLLLLGLVQLLQLIGTRAVRAFDHRA
ncbi:MAG: methionine ABC transporter permease [Polyangiales bacterium]